MRKLFRSACLIAVTLALMPSCMPAHSQLGGGKYVTPAFTGPAQTAPGKPFNFVLTIDIQKGFHIQAQNAKDPYIPTKVAIRLPKGFQAKEAVFPASTTATVAGETIPVYEGKITVKVPATALPTLKGKFQISADISYQACNDKSCFPPATAKATGTIVLSAPGKKKTEADKPLIGASIQTPAVGDAPQKPGLAGEPTAGIKVGRLTISGPKPFELSVGKSGEIVLSLTVASGFHIQAHKPATDYIPTEVTVTPSAGIKAGDPVYPASTTAEVAGTKIPVYEGKVEVRVPVSAASAVGDKWFYKVKVRYQACDARACFPPEEALYESGSLVTTGGGTNTVPSSVVHSPSSGSPGVLGFSISKIQEYVPPDKFIQFLQSGSLKQDSTLTNLLGRSLLLALPLIFLLGLALNLTPCVYPIIPITISYFGGQAGQEGGQKPVVLALFYVLGMALMYSILGVAAGLTGGLFGSQLQNPYVLVGFAVVMFGLALSQFDRPNGMPIWEFQLPQGLRNKAKSRTGVIGAMLMGLMVGVVAAPCIGPAVVALLQWVGAQKSPVLGFAVFFTLALGLGAPYVVLATASGSVKKLPRSGEWMIAVKHIFGVVMIWMGFYYLQTVLNGLIPRGGDYALIGVTVITGLFLLFFDRAGQQAKKFFLFKRALGLAGIGLAIWLAKPAPAEAILWKPYSQEALDVARSQGKKVIVDFTAAWCAQCKELEHNTFSKPEVGRAANDFVTLRADMTNFEGPEAQKLKEQYGIVGLPTVARLVPGEPALASRQAPPG